MVVGGGGRAGGRRFIANFQKVPTLQEKQQKNDVSNDLFMFLAEAESQDLSPIFADPQKPEF